MGLEHALDAVERAGDDRDRVGGQPVGAERTRRRASSSSGSACSSRLIAQLRLEVEPREHRLRAAAAAGVGKSDASRSADVRGAGLRGDWVAPAGSAVGRAQRRARRDARAAAALGDHQPALAEDPVGGVDGRGAGAERSASARTVGSGSPVSSRPSRIAASTLDAISRAVDPLI